MCLARAVMTNNQEKVDGSVTARFGSTRPKYRGLTVEGPFDDLCDRYW